MPENAYCLRVKKSNGERVLALAKRLAILNRALEIQKDNGYLYIPLVRKPEEKEVNALRAEAQNIQIMTKIFLERQQQRKTLIQVLGDKLPPYLLTSVP
ncbi:MAG: hypothetical protein N3E52_05860, partial [Candidatus Bathyarchaeota archaeon]|nr:hypothetical protein [Candidatus Bathyarchaeota archaeon]